MIEEARLPVIKDFNILRDGAGESVHIVGISLFPARPAREITKAR